MENQTVTPNQPVQQPAPQQTAPAGQLKTNRGLLKFILLNIITLGIYSLVIFSGISSDINVIASRYDGKKTMHFCLLFFLPCRAYHPRNCRYCMVPSHFKPYRQ